MKQIKLILPFVLLAILGISISSCKKTEQAKPLAITGGWYLPSADGQNVRSVLFGADGHFEAIFGTYNDSTPGVNTHTIYSGTYVVNGNSLVTTLSTVSVQVNGGTPVVTPTTQKLYENATFSVNSQTLTINYDTYPADAPVRTQAVFIHAMQD